MGERYTVGELIYDGNIYDGMNTEINDLSFYSRWLKKRRMVTFLSYVVAQVGLRFLLHRKDIKLPVLITIHRC